VVCNKNDPSADLPPGFAHCALFAHLALLWSLSALLRDPSKNNNKKQGKEEQLKFTWPIPRHASPPRRLARKKRHSQQSASPASNAAAAAAAVAAAAVRVG
jgi:hypothetical protein